MSHGKHREGAICAYVEGPYSYPTQKNVDFQPTWVNPPPKRIKPRFPFVSIYYFVRFNTLKPDQHTFHVSIQNVIALGRDGSSTPPAVHPEFCGCSHQSSLPSSPRPLREIHGVDPASKLFFDFGTWQSSDSGRLLQLPGWEWDNER